MSRHNIVVLLKHGQFEVVDCRQRDLFTIARERDAGICGVFEDITSAEAFMEKHRPFAETMYSSDMH